MSSFEEEYARAKAKSEPAVPASGEADVFLEAPSYRPPEPPPPPGPAQRGTIMPWSTDAEGNFGFDTKAGIFGMVRNPIEFVGDVAAGRIPADVRNPAYTGGAFETAATFGPGAVASRAGRGGAVRPSSEAIKEAGEEGFKTYRSSGQMYPGNEYQALLQTTRDSMNRAGLIDDPKRASAQHRVIQNELERTRNAPFVTSQDLDNLRIALGAKGAGAQHAREHLFNYIEQNLPPGSGNNVRDAVGNYRQAMHADVVSDKLGAKSRLNRAAGEGSDLSAEQTRTSIAQLLNSRKGLQGFRPNEKAVLEAVAGPETPNWTQQFGEKGRLNTGSLGMMIATAPQALAAAGARSIANRGARKDAVVANEFIRAQSPLARAQFGTASSNFSAAKPGPYSVMANPAIAAAVAQRMLEKQPPPEKIPQNYRVLPDGTVEEFL